MEKRQCRAKKSLGQHFLIDAQAIAAIVESVPEGVCVLEIGPGRGAITRPLLQRAGSVVVVEKDDEFAGDWQALAATEKRLTVAHGDVMALLDEVVAARRPQWIVGNLPYNISGPLTARLVGCAGVDGMVLMYQKEVADRVAAEPGSGRACGGISVLSHYAWSVSRLLRLPPGAFAPPPRVHSAVLRFVPNGRRFDRDEFDALQACVRIGFAHRRKTVANNFRGAVAAVPWDALDIDPGLRPERLTMAQWLVLVRWMRGQLAALG